MSLTNPKNVVTEERLSEFYGEILPYLGGMPEVLANKFSKSDLYSTDEKIIGCWINGKPIYQKTIVTTMPTAGNSKNVAIGASIEWGTYDAQVIQNSAIQKLPVIKPGSTSYANIEWSLRCAIVPNTAPSNKNTILLESKGNASYDNMPTYVTVYYTKTTDAANSFKYANETDYSTDEKIVGTWVDGKPIYQKVINCGALPNTSQKSISTGISNPKMLIDAWGCCTNDTSTAQLIIPRILKDDQDVMVSYAPNLSEVRIKTESNRSALNCYFFLRYTKTTD